MMKKKGIDRFENLVKKLGKLPTTSLASAGQINKDNMKMDNEEFLSTMKDKYPRVLKNINYLECDEGWQDLIQVLTSVIDHELKHLGRDDSSVIEDMYAVQIKEKFGGLRYYMNNSNSFIQGIITFAEAMSFKICERCGTGFGSVSSKSVGGWITTCCDDCHKVFLKNREDNL